MMPLYDPHEVQLIQFNTGVVDFQFAAYNKEVARLFPTYQLGWDMGALKDRREQSYDGRPVIVRNIS